MKFSLFMVVASASLATAGIFVKVIGDAIPAPTIAFYRWLIGALFVGLVLFAKDRTLPFHISRRSMFSYAGVGLLYAIGSLVFLGAYTLAPVQSVSLLSSMVPLFVALLAYTVLSERIRRAHVYSFAATVLALLIMNPFEFTSSVTGAVIAGNVSGLAPVGKATLGNFLALLSAFLGSIQIILSRREEKAHHGLHHVFWVLAFAAVFTSPALLVVGMGSVHTVLIEIVLMGVLSAGVAYLCLASALHGLDADMSSVLHTTVMPLVSVILAVIILGEAVSTRMIIGGLILIASGIYLELHDVITHMVKFRSFMPFALFHKRNK